MQIPNNEEGKTQESKIKKVLFNEVNLVLAIISIVGVCYFGFFSTSYKYQKQIDQLRNDFGTAQQLSSQLQNIKDNDIKEIHLSNDRIENQLIELGKDVARLQALLSVKQIYYEKKYKQINSILTGFFMVCIPDYSVSFLSDLPINKKGCLQD